MISQLYTYALSGGLGLVVGLILAMTGAGGAILSVPLLLYFLSLKVAEAAPISLLAVSLSAALGAWLGLAQHVVRYRAAMLIAAAGIVMTPLGLWVAHQLPNAQLMMVFAIVLLIVAVRMLLQKNTSTTVASNRPCQLNTKTGRFIWTKPCAFALTIGGVIAGFLSGLLGVGGGFVIVPALRRATDAPMHTIVPTSLLVIFLVSASGVVLSAVSGKIQWHIAIPFALGALFGMLVGRSLAQRVSSQLLQRLFALFAAMAALNMLFKAYTHW